MDLTRYPQQLKDLIDKAAEPVAEKLQIPMDQARQAVYLVTEVIRKDWSGDNFYLPKGMAYEIEQRDRQMWAEFNGHNHAELGKKYGLTTRKVYDRLSLVGVEEFARQQPSLFKSD
jgi:Mor family transcriptional regulator